jgi:hypothetical protein
MAIAVDFTQVSHWLIADSAHSLNDIPRRLSFVKLSTFGPGFGWPGAFPYWRW